MSNFFSRIRNKVKSIVSKGQPTSSDVHVNAPLGSKDMSPPLNNLEVELIKSAFGGEVKKDVLTTEGRKHVAESNFVFPDDKRYPIHDISHARNALARSSGKPEEAKVKAAVYRKYPSLKPDTVAKTDTLRVAVVAVKRKGKILFGKQVKTGKWTMPAGHLEMGEDFVDGAKRELLEETGIDAKSKDLKPITEVHEVTNEKGERMQVQGFKYKAKDKPKFKDTDGEVSDWTWFDVSDGLPDELKNNLQIPAERDVVLHSLGLSGLDPTDEVVDPEGIQNQVENEDVQKDDGGNDVTVGGAGDNDLDGTYDMAQIVSGMDYEMMCNNITDENSAKELALMNLQDDPHFYVKKWLEQDGSENKLEKDTGENQDLQSPNVGINLDLGSGQNRAPGHVGIDTYQYDHGTVVHDLNLGIPFPDNCASHVQMIDAMDGIDDPKVLLSEIARVLMPGGQFYYEGPNAIDNYPEWLNEEDRQQVVAKEEGDEKGITRQLFTRIAAPDAATANDSEPRIGVPPQDALPADALLALDATGYYWSDATSSGRGNRAHGYPSQGGLVAKTKIEKSQKVKIHKIDKKKQIAYGVVLSPNEVDTQDDLMTPEDIEEAAHYYMKHSRVIKSAHQGDPIGAYPVESWIAPVDIDFESGQYGPQKIKKGAWLLGVKIEDPKEWAKVEDGTYQGFSVGGDGVREPMTTAAY